MTIVNTPGCPDHGGPQCIHRKTKTAPRYATAMAALEYLSDRYYHSVMEDGDTAGDRIDVIREALEHAASVDVRFADAIGTLRHIEEDTRHRLAALEARTWPNR